MGRGGQRRGGFLSSLLHLLLRDLLEHTGDILAESIGKIGGGFIACVVIL